MLHEGFKALQELPRWLVFRIDADGAKYPLSDGVLGYAMACAEVLRLRGGAPAGVRYELGYELRQGDGFWCLDIDALQGGESDPRWPVVQWLAEQGALLEWSQSGRGVHVWGRGALPHPHRQRLEINGLRYEVYSYARRMIVGARSEGVRGDAGALVAPPPWLIVEGEEPGGDVLPEGAMPQWSGIADDAELLRAMRNARSNGARMLRGVLTDAQLLDGDVPEGADRSQLDAQLAERLAWWTGGDMARVLRLMRGSGLYRDKWDREDYLPRTVRQACVQVRKDGKCHQRPVVPVGPVVEPVVPVGPVTLGLLDAASGIARAREIIRTSEGTMAGLEAACAQVLAMGLELPPYEWDELQDAVAKHARQVLGKEKFSIRNARALLPAPRGGAMPAGGVAGSPDWVSEWAFLASSNNFYWRNYPEPINKDAAERIMLRNYRDVLPRGTTGKLMSPTELFFSEWEGPVAWAHAYLPGQDFLVPRGMLTYANTYNPDSLPARAAQMSVEGARRCAMFERHMMLVCGERQEVFDVLMAWLANAALRPGSKVAWAPLIKGQQGSGKSFVGYLIRKALGDKLYHPDMAGTVPRVESAGHVHVVGPSELANSGGFTDWAAGRAVTILEEIYVTGGRKWDVDNMMKDYITAPLVSINRKGASALKDFPNVSNYIAFTNHDDAVPLDEGTRRWLVIFTTALDGMLVSNPHYMVQYFAQLWDALIDVDAGELCLWLSRWLEREIPARAPATRERGFMAAAGDSDLMSAVRDYVGQHAVIALEHLSTHLMMLSAGKPVSKKELRRALGDCGLTLWQGGGDHGRAKEGGRNGQRVTLFVRHYLAQEPSAKELLAQVPGAGFGNGFLGTEAGSQDLGGFGNAFGKLHN